MRIDPISPLSVLPIVGIKTSGPPAELCGPIRDMKVSVKRLPQQNAIGVVGPGRDLLCHERYASGLDSMVAGFGA